jgi:membrane-associated phospholipid phosphatase
MQKKYKYYFTNKEFVISTVVSVFLLAISLVINFHAGVYATINQSNAVTDIILSNIRVYDVDYLFTYGAVFFWLFIIFLFLKEPSRIPFILKSIALFVVIRAVFVSLTHLGPFPTQLQLDSDIISKFSFGGDLFFSGHTGLPFLMSLIFWKDKPLRILFFVSAVFFGIVVLMSHMHYSIDVLSAFFITYSIFHIAQRIFKKDQEFFNSNLLEAPESR